MTTGKCLSMYVVARKGERDNGPYFFTGPTTNREADCVLCEGELLNSSGPARHASNWMWEKMYNDDLFNIFYSLPKVCDMCNTEDQSRHHPPEQAIDGTEKWWQSPPLSRGMRYNEVNLTIDLGQVSTSWSSQTMVLFIHLSRVQSRHGPNWDPRENNRHTVSNYISKGAPYCIDLFLNA